MTWPLVFCSCGRPVHYSNDESRARVETLIAEKGECIAITTDAGTWLVPRHYVALHGVAANTLARLARLHGWEKITVKDDGPPEDRRVEWVEIAGRKVDADKLVCPECQALDLGTEIVTTDPVLWKARCSQGHTWEFCW